MPLVDGVMLRLLSPCNPDSSIIYTIGLGNMADDLMVWEPIYSKCLHF